MIEKNWKKKKLLNQMKIFCDVSQILVRKLKEIRITWTCNFPNNQNLSQHSCTPWHQKFHECAMACMDSLGIFNEMLPEMGSEPVVLEKAPN